MIVKITNAANKVLRYLITAILLALVVMLFAQIIGRTCFKVGVPWLEELAKILFVCSMFLGICVGVKEASHIKIDVLTNWLEGKGKTAAFIINAISWLGELVFFGYLDREHEQIYLHAAHPAGAGVSHHPDLLRYQHHLRHQQHL